MANKIATEKEAAEKGGISGYNSKRLVKYEKLETFGCTTESVKANNRLVPVNELLELKPRFTYAVKNIAVPSSFKSEFVLLGYVNVEKTNQTCITNLVMNYPRIIDADYLTSNIFTCYFESELVMPLYTPPTVFPVALNTRGTIITVNINSTVNITFNTRDSKISGFTGIATYIENE